MSPAPEFEGEGPVGSRAPTKCRTISFFELFVFALQTKTGHSADCDRALCRPRQVTLQTKVGHSADRGEALCRLRQDTLQTEAGHSGHWRFCPRYKIVQEDCSLESLKTPKNGEYGWKMKVLHPDTVRHRLPNSKGKGPLDLGLLQSAVL